MGTDAGVALSVSTATNGTRWRRSFSCWAGVRPHCTNSTPSGCRPTMRSSQASGGLTGRHPDLPQLESAARVAPDGTRLLFLLDHAAEALEVPSGAGAVDLLTGERIEAGQPLGLDAYGVRVLREDG